LKDVKKGDDLFSELVQDDRLQFFQGAWRHKDCPYMCMEIYLDGQGRCKGCRNLDSNIKSKRFPMLFGGRSDVPSDGAEEVEDSRTISEAVIENEEAFRGRVILRLESHWDMRAAEGGCLDVSSDEELRVAAKQMKLAGVLVLDLKDGRSFTCCQGDGCDKCFVRIPGPMPAHSAISANTPSTTAIVMPNAARTTDRIASTRRALFPWDRSVPKSWPSVRRH